MLLFDAHITKLQATKSTTPPSLARNQLDAAHTIYQTLLTKKFAVSKYLVDQAKSGLAQEKSLF